MSILSIGHFKGMFGRYRDMQEKSRAGDTATILEAKFQPAWE